MSSTDVVQIVYWYAFASSKWLNNIT